MNDFTKEDLITIFNSCAQHSLEGWANISAQLLGKIQSMIHGYCEHEPEIISFSKCPLGSDMTYKCKKCQELYR